MKMTENPYNDPLEGTKGERDSWDDGYRAALRDVSNAFLAMPGEPIVTPLEVVELMVHTLATIDPRSKWTVKP